ncbi:MAG: tetratricopeptide repeat protein [Bacteroidota bacterium]
MFSTQKSKYVIIVLLTFILYGNTLFHEYALDDALVITENEYTLSGFKGIDDLFTEAFFNGFFDQKNKKLVAGGRYRPLSMVTFAIEWQLVMGTPFDGINHLLLERKMNHKAPPNFILPSQKLLKNLTATIHIENEQLRKQQQESMLENAKALNAQEKNIILRNLERMHNRRPVVLFVSHFINVLLYALTGMFLFYILTLLFPQYKSGTWFLSLPFIVTLLFVLHPIHTEVIANIKGRDEILSLLGALLAVLFSWKYLQKHHVGYLFLSFIAFLTGLFSKEVAVTFLAIIPLSIYFFKSPKVNPKIYFYTLIPLILATIIYFYVRYAVVGEIKLEPGNELMNNSFLGMRLSEKYATIFYTLLLYLKLLFFPHPLTYDYYPYHIQAMSWTDIWPVISLVLHLALGIYALTGIRKKDPVSFGILFYIIALSPMSNILFPIGVFMNERFMFVPSIGFVLIVGYLITQKLPVWIKKQQIIAGLLVIIFSLYGVKTISRNMVWKDDFTLFTTDVKTSVNSAKSNTSAGGKLIEEALKPGNKTKRNIYLKQAVGYLRKAIEIHPSYNDALLLMGNAQWELYHQPDSLFKYYQRILEHTPKYVRVYDNIFKSEINQIFDEPERVDENLKLLHQLKKYHPEHYHVNYYLGRLYGRYKHELQKSLQYLKKAAKINPGKIEVYKDLGVAYGMSGNFTESAKALNKAVKLDKNDPVLRINLAMSYMNIKEFEKAKQMMDEAYALDFKPKDASALVNLGVLYQNLGDKSKARVCFSRAQKLNPELFRQE